MPLPVLERRYTLVYAEDDDFIRKAVIRCLVLHKYDIYAFPNAESALTHIDRLPWDILVTDNTMGGMSGLDLLKRVRNDPRFVGRPVIVHSADNIKAAVESAGGIFAEKPKIAPLYEALECAKSMINSAK